MEGFEVLANSSVRLMVPLLLAALGELISQRAGIMNVGLEGMMVAGAFASYIAMILGWGLPAAILFGAFAGVTVALLMALGSVWLKGNVFLVGFALFILVPGIADFIYIQGGWTVGTPALPALSIPFLSTIPFVGSAIASQNIFYYLAVGFTLLIWLLFARMRAGLVISAVGHSPLGARTKGVSPRLVQTYALIACGALAGLGGASLSLGSISSYAPNIIGGRGFIAIAIVILGRWTVLGAAIGALSLAVLSAVQLSLAQSSISVQLLGALPWVVVIVLLVVSSRMKSNVPRTLQ